jgi:predicted DCC family thiol-disulfide oxidoreductase YuxK
LEKENKTAKELSKNILLFDGECNLCNSTVQWIIAHNKKQNILFASLQSEVGKALLLQYNIKANYIDSVVYIENQKAYLKSNAVLSLTKHLDGVYKALYILKIIPGFISDFFYKHFAKRRYKWFGTTDTCWVMTPELKSRFL